MSIPKIIHYCWLSSERMPSLMERCMASWSNVLGGYELMRWDTDRFDLDSCIWTREAFDRRKYAFASDYIRCLALYRYGGIYLDCDVEVVRPFDPFLSNPYMIGREGPALVEAAAIGAEQGSPLFAKLLEYYRDRHFILPDGRLDTTPMPVIMERIILDNFIVKDITHPEEAASDDHTLSILPEDFFSPKSCADGKIRATGNTYCIHHYNQSWQSPIRKYGRKIILGIGGEKLKRITRALVARRLS